MIKRYFIDQDDDGDACACFMTQDADGEYVTYSDHRAVVRELIEALDNLLSACELPGDHCEIEQAIPCARVAIAKYQEGKE